MQWAGLRSQAPAPAAVWVGPTPSTARWPQGRLPAARRALVVVASAAASDSNSSSNSPGRDEEREEVVRREKEEKKAVASLLMRSQKYAMLKQQLAVAAQFEVPRQILQ